MSENDIKSPSKKGGERSEEECTRLEAIIRSGMNEDPFSDETVDALLELTDHPLILNGKYNDDRMKLLEEAWLRMDGADVYKASDRAAAMADIESEPLEPLDVIIPNQNVLASPKFSANWHESLEKGRVLEQVASVWRVPESYGSLLSAITMMEIAVQERQIKGLLEATHPDRSVLNKAKKLSLDNAEVVQSMMMVSLTDERDAAIAKGQETTDVLNRAVASNQELTHEVERLNEELVMKAGDHVASYANLKDLFCKLMVEREASIKKQQEAMNTAQSALSHLMNDKSELLREVESLYTQLDQFKEKKINHTATGSAVDHNAVRAERLSAKKREAELQDTINQLKQNISKEKEKHVQTQEENKALLERYQFETKNKIKLLEQSLRMQDETHTIAKEAREQIRNDIQSKFDKQLRALLTEIEESEERNKEISEKYAALKSHIDRDEDEVKALLRENAALLAENKSMKNREKKRKQREEKMAELAANLVAESNSNDMLVQRLKESQAKLDEFTRRGLVATTVASVKSHAIEARHNPLHQPSSTSSSTSTFSPTALNLSRRLPPPSIAGGSGARSSEFNDEIQRKLDGLTSGSLFGSTFNTSGKEGTGLAAEPASRPAYFPSNKTTKAINKTAPQVYM